MFVLKEVPSVIDESTLGVFSNVECIAIPEPITFNLFLSLAFVLFDELQNNKKLVDNVGASTFIELSVAQSTFISAKSDFTQAQYNLIFQEKLLDFYLGKLTGEDIEF